MFYIPLGKHDLETATAILEQLQKECGIQNATIHTNLFAITDEFSGILISKTDIGAVVITDKFIIFPVKNYKEQYMLDAHWRLQ